MRRFYSILDLLLSLEFGLLRVLEDRVRRLMSLVLVCGVLGVVCLLVLLGVVLVVFRLALVLFSVTFVSFGVRCEGLRSWLVA